ncbi:MAG: hypothetical protein DI598_13680 [Pseudopedobacter saltans]|uniref:Outer membrane protein beta-barrel domain-containing protein n=1 Tax=Pseudopedobacter saltans TaxID=151895 RepID=A0A2W5EV77_9SPHI|nr:MAG: hypothetical protein DI598_13680 [Pseudopedobacter saltans]
MKTILCLAILFKCIGIIISGILCVNAVSAQNIVGSSEYSFGIEGALPIGNFEKSNKFGFGGSIKYAYNFTENVALSLQVGYLHFSQKDSLENPNPYMVKRVVPVLVGLRYSLSKPFYIEPQVGAANTGYRIAGEDENQTNIGYGLNIGYVTKSHWDISLNFKGSQLERNNLFWCGLKLAYTLPVTMD